MSRIAPASNGSFLERCTEVNLATAENFRRRGRRIDGASLACAFAAGFITGIVATIYVVIS